MLAFDIETMGFLDTKPLPPITCVCLYAPGIEHKLRFYKVSDEEFETNKATLFGLLDAAPCLAGFNAVYFDLEYIRVFFKVDVSAWVLKCKDPFMIAKHVLKGTCGLNFLLELNGMGAKTGSGGEAVALAEQERWSELLDYCLMDARLTYDLCALPTIAFSMHLRGSTDDDLLWRFSLERSDAAANVALRLDTITPTVIYRLC